MDRPALRERELLVMTRLGPQECTDLIEQATEAPGRIEAFEPTRGPVPPFDAPMILLQVVV